MKLPFGRRVYAKGKSKGRGGTVTGAMTTSVKGPKSLFLRSSSEPTVSLSCWSCSGPELQPLEAPPAQLLGPLEESSVHSGHEESGAQPSQGASEGEEPSMHSGAQPSEGASKGFLSLRVRVTECQDRESHQKKLVPPKKSLTVFPLRVPVVFESLTVFLLRVPLVFSCHHMEW